MATTRKEGKKTSAKRSVKSDRGALSPVITVRISTEEKIRLEKIMANLDIKRYSDVMRMALQMVNPTIQY